MERIVDVAVIGAGTAGLNAMTQVREVTDNFVLINGGKLGTTCARVGCMPSKSLIQIADDFHRRYVLAQEGIYNGHNLTVDVSQALEHVRTLRDRFVGGIIEDLIKPLGDKFIGGHAEFIAPNVLKIGQTTVKAEKIVVATGSRPLIPDHGMIRIYAERKSGKLLGSEMAAAGGEHLAHLLAWSIQQELTVFDLLGMPFYHPTIEETLRAALLDLADAVDRKKPAVLGLEV